MIIYIHVIIAILVSLPSTMVEPFHSNPKMFKIGMMGPGVFGVAITKERQLVSHVVALHHVWLFKCQLIKLSNIKNFSDRPATCSRVDCGK